jgi:hypothetical protein
MATQLADDMHRVSTVEDLRVAGHQHAHIVKGVQGPWQCSRYIA